MVSYNKQFYKKLKGGSLQSAEEYVPIVMQYLKPKSVLDLGCGIGTWLSVFNKHGVSDIYGVDGNYVNRNQLLIPSERFVPADISTDMPKVIRVDMAYSLEVAEHIPESRADEIVKYLTDCSDVVMFGSATPKQGGTDHINEQWQSYWVEKFSALDYVPITFFRDFFWYNSNVELWYRQNTLLYIKRGSSLLSVFANHDPENLYDIVHPQFYLLKYGRFELVDDFISLIRRGYFWLRSNFI